MGSFSAALAALAAASASSSSSLFFDDALRERPLDGTLPTAGGSAPPPSMTSPSTTMRVASVEASAASTRPPLPLPSVPSSLAAFVASMWKSPPSPMASSSSYVPCSTTRPPLTTAMLSAWRIVERRCAIATVVRFSRVITSSSAACTTRSLSVSSADVASSSSRIFGFLMIARAIATRCFCPPLSLPPPCPTSVA